MLDDLEHAHGATISVWMGDLAGRAWLTMNERVTHHPASTVKLPLLVAVHRAADAGRLALDDEVTVRATLPSVVAGRTYTATQDYDQDDAVWERHGRSATLRWLGERAIIRSSNLATNLLIDRVGVAAVNAVYDDLGSPASPPGRSWMPRVRRDAGLPRSS
jgi:beta-lactamase class A